MQTMLIFGKANCHNKVDTLILTIPAHNPNSIEEREPAIRLPRTQRKITIRKAIGGEYMTRASIENALPRPSFAPGINIGGKKLSNINAIRLMASRSETPAIFLVPKPIQ